MSRAIILISGGLDSAVTAGVAISGGSTLVGLTFLYGQRHAVEVERARELATAPGFESHHVIELEPFPAGSSSLTDAKLEVPKHRPDEQIDAGGIPSTYVPARNTIFLSRALAWCEALDADEIYTGVNALDYSGYPDCRPEFLRAFENLARLATRAGVEEGRRIRVRAPLLHRTKAEIIRLGAELGVPFEKTWSCYSPVVDPDRPDGPPLACGACDSCILRARGFAEAGVSDPVPTVRPGVLR